VTLYTYYVRWPLRATRLRGVWFNQAGLQPCNALQCCKFTNASTELLRFDILQPYSLYFTGGMGKAAPSKTLSTLLQRVFA